MPWRKIVLAHFLKTKRDPDYETSAPFLKRAAAQGHAEALYTLGTFHVDSDVVPQDYELAKEYFVQALEQGHSSAQVELERFTQWLDSQMSITRALRNMTSRPTLRLQGVQSMPHVTSLSRQGATHRAFST